MNQAGALPAPRRVGVFGGAFDPPHKAHRALAQSAIEALSLDELRIIPTGDAWHKTRALSPAADRLAMAQLAFADLPRIVVDERELHRPGPTYTIDTLEALNAEAPDAQLYLIMGEDQFAAFRQWHRWEDIARLAIICIAGRALSTGATAGFDTLPGLPARTVRLPMPLMSVSATAIRTRAASAQGAAADLGDVVNDAVARYISLHHLYTPVNLPIGQSTE